MCRDLTSAQDGSLTTKNEETVLAAIRQLTVCEENTIVALVTLNNVTQDQEETVRSFGARLGGQAGVCKFVCKTGHGVWAPPPIRQKECVAYGQTCSKCTLTNHLPSIYRSSKSTNEKHTTEHEGAVFNSLCVAMDYNSSFENKVIYLDHHVYDNLNDTWTKKSSQPQPYVSVSVETKVED